VSNQLSDDIGDQEVELLRKAQAKYGLDGYLKRHPYSKSKLTLEALEQGCRRFEAEEPRDSMYRIARFLIEEWWADEAKLVDALSVVLLTWNSAFYRYGAFDSGALEACIRENRAVIEGFRKRSISSLVQADHTVANELFKSVSKALARVEEKKLETPVGCVKALHLLAPNFFPLWDQYIAPAYNCPYRNDELFPHIAYRVFCDRIREIAASVESEIASAPASTKSWLMSKPLLKRIDEYNYVTFTLPELQKEREKRKQKAKKLAASGK
jgi:hypothetical protein